MNRYRFSIDPLRVVLDPFFRGARSCAEAGHGCLTQENDCRATFGDLGPQPTFESEMTHLSVPKIMPRTRSVSVMSSPTAEWIARRTNEESSE
jgi:hypothetical protein